MNVVIHVRNPMNRNPMNPHSSHEIPEPSNGFVATSLDKLVKEEECEEPPLPKKSKKNNHAQAIKAVMSNCSEIPTACEKINAAPEPRKGKKWRNETVPNEDVPPIKKHKQQVQPKRNNITK